MATSNSFLGRDPLNESDTVSSVPVNRGGILGVLEEVSTPVFKFRLCSVLNLVYLTDSCSLLNGHRDTRTVCADRQGTVTVDITFRLLVRTAFNEYQFFLSLLSVLMSDMELYGSTQEDATGSVTGPPLQRSPEASDSRDPVAEVRGGSRAANRLSAEAGVPATSGAQRGTFMQSPSGSGDAPGDSRMVYSDQEVQLRSVVEYDRHVRQQGRSSCYISDGQEAQQESRWSV